MKILIVTSEWPTSKSQTEAPFLAEQVADLRKKGLDVVVYHFRGRSNPFRYAFAWLRLRLVHQIDEFDLVHAHFGQSGLVALPCSVPLIVTFHGSDLYGMENSRGRQTLRGRILRRASTFVARHASRVIVVSSGLLDFLPSGLKTEVIPCGIDLREFEPVPRELARRKLGFGESEAIVLFVGDPRNSIKNVRLAELVVNALEANLQPQLVVLHGQPRARVRDFMSASDAMIVTSHHEGSPTAVKEALACGLPIVSVAVGDVPERLAGIPECRVCSSRDPLEIAEDLGEVLRERRRINSNSIALGSIEIGAVSERLVDVYRAVTENAKKY